MPDGGTGSQTCDRQRRCTGAGRLAAREERRTSDCRIGAGKGHSGKRERADPTPPAPDLERSSFCSATPRQGPPSRCQAALQLTELFAVAKNRHFQVVCGC